ncbi:hypothetical protein B0T17DRAFT_502126 [Bombardia bombarda]|uniref:Uncharacterized protein n=1 Tax=Bombardia bombarda TaxID=252184 RepID=A0AA39XK10_9PEZI|nr:hypothetical protein B0T17DRAFT_502126 [Bombardia bombarda]
MASLTAGAAGAAVASHCFGIRHHVPAELAATAAEEGSPFPPIHPSRSPPPRPVKPHLCNIWGRSDATNGRKGAKAQRLPKSLAKACRAKVSVTRLPPVFAELAFEDWPLFPSVCLWLQWQDCDYDSNYLCDCLLVNHGALRQLGIKCNRASMPTCLHHNAVVLGRTSPFIGTKKSKKQWCIHHRLPYRDADGSQYSISRASVDPQRRRLARPFSAFRATPAAHQRSRQGRPPEAIGCLVHTSSDVPHRRSCFYGAAPNQK